MATIVLNNLPFNDSDLKDEVPNLALGRFMTAWSQVEVVCSFLFRAVGNMPATSWLVIFDHMGTKEQINVVQTLAESLPVEADKIALIQLMDEVQTISVKRNKIVHASWGKFNGDAARFYWGMTMQHHADLMNETQKGKTYPGKYVFTVKHLEALTSECVKLRENLEVTLRSINSRTQEDEHNAFREKVRQRREAAQKGLEQAEALTEKLRKQRE